MSSLWEVQVPPSTLREWFGHYSQPFAEELHVGVQVRWVTDQQLERDFREWVWTLCREAAERDVYQKKYKHCLDIERLVYILLKQVEWENIATPSVRLAPLPVMALEELKKHHHRKGIDGRWSIWNFRLMRAVAGLTRYLEGRPTQDLARPRRETPQDASDFALLELPSREDIGEKLRDVQATPGELRAWFGELRGPTCGCCTTDKDVRIQPSTDQQKERDFRDYIFSLSGNRRGL